MDSVTLPQRACAVQAGASGPIETVGGGRPRGAAASVARPETREFVGASVGDSRASKPLPARICIREGRASLRKNGAEAPAGAADVDFWPLARWRAMRVVACIVVPWLADRLATGTNWQAMAWRIHDHLPYSELQFFPKLAAFNIGWHEAPKRTIYSYRPPRGYLTKPGFANHGGDHSAFYPGFPRLAVAEAVDAAWSR